MSVLSRRDFLKLGVYGLAGLTLPPLDLLRDPYVSQQGRVTTRMVFMYDRPSANALPVRFLYRDLVINIRNAAVSEDAASHNRIWYEVGSDEKSEGFVYSGNIQPVKTVLNTPQTDIPKEGLLAEVSVPYSDACEKADPTSKVAYRIYYETTHWVKDVVPGADGRAWYQIRDDKWDKLYYAPAEHLRIMSRDEIAPITPDVPLKDKKILVKLESQVLYAYEGSTLVFAAPVSTGGIFRVGTYTTPQGNFITYYKRPSRHMAAGDIAASGYDLPGVPWVQYITESGISFHGTFWHNDFGRPRSHGCINLATPAAKWLFRWTSPSVPPAREFTHGSIGTKVEITL